MRHFEDYTRQRREFLERCEEISAVAHDLVAGQTELEALGADSRLDATPVDAALEEVRRRLASTTIEVGVFGEIKRGKSTLLNALVGSVVSSMRITPETAVPVWVETGDTWSAVVYEDGGTEEFEDPADARERGSQKYRRRSSNRPVARVHQRLPVDWLPQGLRIVDTPGLDDPSHIDDYEALTLAELDRVSAAVFVFLSPPGPGSEEMRLLRSLGEHGVDKAFIVCNFYPDHWRNQEDRENVLDYIRSLLVGDGPDGEASNGRVYGVNARDGLEAILRGDHEAYAASGVLALREELEAYLTTGALSGMVGAVRRRLDVAVQLVGDQVVQRRRLLEDPQLVKQRRGEVAVQLEASRSVIDGARREIASAAKELTAEITRIMQEPYRQSKARLAGLKRVSDVQSLEQRLMLMVETAASRAAVQFDSTVGVVETRVRRRLFESFGVTERLAGSGVALRTADISGPEGLTGLVKGGIDPATTALAAGATAAGAGLIGGSLAGGVGIALIAAGPVGWLIGAVAGLVIGAGVGGAAGGLATRGSLSAHEREHVSRALERQIASIEQSVATTCRDWEQSLDEQLVRDQDMFFGEQERELARIDRLLADERSRQNALRDVERQFAQLRALEVL